MQIIQYKADGDDDTFRVIPFAFVDGGGAGSALPPGSHFRVETKRGKIVVTATEATAARIRAEKRKPVGESLRGWCKHLRESQRVLDDLDVPAEFRDAEWSHVCSIDVSGGPGSNGWVSDWEGNDDDDEAGHRG